MTMLTMSGLHCNEETDEVGADEPYVLVTRVNLANGSVPDCEVTRYGPFDNVDQGDNRFRRSSHSGPAR